MTDTPLLLTWETLSKDKVVWIAKRNTGAVFRYHSNPDCRCVKHSNNIRESLLRHAEARGLTLCRRC